jgi:long-chain acyl-CoA synthetase
VDIGAPWLEARREPSAPIPSSSGRSAGCPADISVRSPSGLAGAEAGAGDSLSDGERATLDAGIKRVRALPLSVEQEETLATLRRRVGLDLINKTLCAAAPCPPTLREHYHGLGIPFGENFAMTEIGSASTQRAGLIDFGTLGPASPGYELRIAEDGELLVRSP